MTGNTNKSTMKNILRKHIMLSVFLIFLLSLSGINIYGEDNDLSLQQWHFYEDNGVFFPNWNQYDEEGQPLRNVAKVNDEDVVVAILDTGIDYNHEDLKDVMWTGGDIDELKSFGGSIYGYDAVGEVVDGVIRHDDPMDRQGHGTHVAGIIAAKWNHIGVSGALSGVKLMAVRTSRNGDIDLVKAGMEYVLAAKKAGVNVAAINLSWNGGIGNSTPEILYSTIKELTENGITLCISAGNDYSDLNIDPSVSSFFRLIPGVIVVEASDRNKDLAEFSNYGSVFSDVVTPGEKILSTFFDPDDKDESGEPRHDLYKEMDGTSMAAPIATAASALLYAHNPELSAAHRAARIIETASYDEKYKAEGGFLNIAGFLDDENSLPYFYGGDYDGELVNLYGFDLGSEGRLVIDDAEYNTTQWSDTLISLYADDLEPGEHFITVSSDKGSRGYWVCISADTSEARKLDSQALQDKIITSVALDDQKMFISADEKYYPQNKILLEKDFQSGTWNSYVYDRPGVFSIIVSNDGVLYSFDTFDYSLYRRDPQSGSNTKLAELSVSEGYAHDYSLFSVDDDIYLTYKHENYPDSEYIISRYAEGSFFDIAVVRDELIKIYDLYRNNDELILLTGSFSDDYLSTLINAYRITDQEAAKLPFEVKIANFSRSPSARGYGSTIAVFPVEQTWTSPYGDNSDCFAYALNQYDLSDSALIKSTTIGGGHLSTLSKTGIQIANDHVFVVGSADSMPYNSFIYQLDLASLYDVTLMDTQGGTISADHDRAQGKETVTLNAEPDDHHSFDSWLVTDSKGNAIEVTDNNFVMPEDNVTVSALFTIRKCIVSFDSNGGSGQMKPVQADIDTTFILPECTFAPPGEDMLFDCWIATFKGKEAVEKKAGDTVVLSDDLMLKAKWKDFVYEYSGNINRWILNREGSLDFVFIRTVNDYKTYSNFLKTGRIEIDGAEIRSYKSRQGSLIITLNSSYLNTLSIGTHTMKVFFSDGSCSTVFVVDQQHDSYVVPLTGIN